MAATYTSYFGDIEYDVSIDGGDVILETVYTDLGIDPEDLYFVPKKGTPLRSDGTPVMKSLADRMCEIAYEKFIDDWGSEKALHEATYGDMKYEESKYDD